jgi:hypothetical protein
LLGAWAARPCESARRFGTLVRRRLWQVAATIVRFDSHDAVLALEAAQMKAPSAARTAVYRVAGVTGLADGAKRSGPVP